MSDVDFEKTPKLERVADDPGGRPYLMAREADPV